MKDEEPAFGELHTSQIVSSLTTAIESYLIRYGILSGPSEPTTVEKILLLFSGGVDSSVLLHLLKNIFINKNKHAKKKIHLLHINYHLRGKESDAEAMFIKNLATTDELILHQFDEYPATTSGNIQGLARSLRYEHAIAVTKAEEIFHVFTAHHLDDQLETFLLNLLKGKSPKTLAGTSTAKSLTVGGSDRHINSRRSDVLLHRPFIASLTTKSDILCYSELVGLSYSNDSSNAKSNYERNYLRNEIIPRINADGHFPNWERNLVRVMDYLQREDNLIRELSQSYLAPLPKWFGEWTIPGFRLTKLFFTELDGHQSQATLLHHALTTHFPEYRFAHAEIDEILMKLTGKNKNPKMGFAFPLDKKLFRHPRWGEIVFSRGWVAPLIKYVRDEEQANKKIELGSTTVIPESKRITLSLGISATNNIITRTLILHGQNHISLVKITEENKNIPRINIVIPQTSSLNVAGNDLSLLPLSSFLEQKKKTGGKFRIQGKTIEKKLEGKKYPLPVKGSLLVVLSGDAFLGVIDPYNSQLFHKKSTTPSEYWEAW